MMRKLLNKWKSIPLGARISLAYTVCSILQRCLSFITLPLFSRLLTTEQYGDLTNYHSWHSLLSIFLTLNLAYGSFGKAMVKYDNDRYGYISSVEGICLVLSVVFLGLYLPFQSFWNKWFELPTSIMIFMIIEILCSTATSLWCGKQRFEFKYISVIFVTLLLAVVSPVLAYFMVINTTEKGYARIMGYCLTTVAVGGFFFVRNAIIGKKIYNRDYWKYALGFNIPLLSYYLSQMIFNQSDRIIISHILGKDKAAIYGVTYSLATILTFVLNAINNSYIPWFYDKLKNNRAQENRKISLAIACIMGLLLMGVVWFAPEIILILAGEKYTGAIYVVPPVATSVLLLLYTQFFINIEFYYEDKKSLVFASMGSALVNITLNWLFIEKYGLIAAAYTTLLSYVIFAISNYLAMKKIMNKLQIKDTSFDYKQLLCLLLFFVVVAVWGVCMYGSLIIRVIITIIVLLIVIFKRNFFIKYFLDASSNTKQ